MSRASRVVRRRAPCVCRTVPRKTLRVPFLSPPIRMMTSSRTTVCPRKSRRRYPTRRCRSPRRVTLMATATVPCAHAAFLRTTHARRARRGRGMSTRPAASGASSDDAGTSGVRRRRMIALHGKGGNAASFEAYMRPLVEASAETWEWEFLEGPHSTGGSGRAWWNLPPGVRTFEATELDGADESLSMLDDAWPFDGILGFSQGAMLAAVACGRGLRGGNRPEVAIVVGAAWPTALGDQLERLKRVEWAAAEAEDVITPERVAAAAESAPDPLVRSLHVVGKRDEMNPPAQAMRVAEAFFCPELLEHDGGHVVPMDQSAVDKYLETMR